MAKKTTDSKRRSPARKGGAPRGKGGKVRRIVFSVIAFGIVAVTVFFLMSPGSGQVSIFENALGSLVTPVQNAFRTAASGVRNFTTTWRSYNALQADYNAISFENEQLRMELQSADEAVEENQRLQDLLDARSTYESLDPIYAKVIARDAGPWFETFSVNRGSSAGVSTGMAVVNGSGLVGRVYEVGLNYAKVITIIDSRSAVACLMQRTRDNGVMRGQISASDSVASCHVYYLPNVNSITPGDIVITSGTDSLYPKGLRIGTVTALSLDAGSEGTYAIVTPSVDFQRIEEVFILRTVIETDSDAPLPAMVTPNATYQRFATLAPDETPTPAPSDENSIWSYPTSTPSPDDSDYANYSVGNLLEDEWASEH